MTINNESKYKTLAFGLELAFNLKMKNIKVSSTEDLSEETEDLALPQGY